MKNVKSLLTLILLVILTASWMPTSVVSSQASGPNKGASPADSLNLEYVGHTGGDINLVTLQGNYAYINEGTSLTILDISVPGSVAVLGRSPLFSSWIGGIAVSGNYAYIANGDSGLRVMWIPNPASLFEWSRFDTPGSVYDVALAGDYAYIADWADLTGGGLRVVNVAVPEFPYQTGFLETDMAESVTLSGSYAYVVRGMGRPLLIVDISDPSNPVEVGSYDPSAMSTAVAVVGDYAYLETFGSGLRVLDVSDPTNPTEIGIFNSSASAVDITVQGSYAYLAEVNSPMGLRIVDVSDPTNPTEVGYHATPAWAYGVAVSDDFAYVAGSTSGLRVVDVSDPTNVIETDYYIAPNQASKVMVVEDYAYVADGGNGLQVVDVSDPINPHVVGVSSTEGYIEDVVVQGIYAYLADMGINTGRGLRIVDVSDVANPTEVGFFSTPGQVGSVAVAGDYAYVSDSQNGLRVVDISNPTNPAEVGLLSVFDPKGVSVAGNYAYITLGIYGDMQVIDVSVPSQPVVVGTFSTGNFATDVEVLGDYAYLANGEGGLRVVDITNPISPTEVGYYDTPGIAASSALGGGFAYVADGESGLRMIDVTDPTSPVEVGYYDTPNYASGVSVEADFIYTADGSTGVIVLHVPITTTTSILSDDPDPSLVSQPFTVTFEVTSSLGIPTGVVTVTVSEAGGLCSGELVDGQGSCQIALSAPGDYTLTATYAGEGSFLPSSTSELHSVEMRRVHLPLLAQDLFICTDFFDDFSDPTSGWYTGEDSDGRVAYLNGEYSVLVKPKNYYWILGAPACDQVNYTVEADARWAGNSGASYGLIFGIQGDFEQFYSYEVNSDYQEYALYRYDPSSWTQIAPIAYSAAINPGAGTNHLKATRSGDAITLEVNGTVLGTWFDGTITGASYTGLIVSSYNDLANAEARFDNFNVTGLGSAASAAAATLDRELSEAQSQASAYRQSRRQWSWR